MLKCWIPWGPYRGMVLLHRPLVLFMQVKAQLGIPVFKHISEANLLMPTLPSLSLAKEMCVLLEWGWGGGRGVEWGRVGSAGARMQA